MTTCTVQTFDYLHCADISSQKQQPVQLQVTFCPHLQFYESSSVCDLSLALLHMAAINFLITIIPQMWLVNFMYQMHNSFLSLKGILYTDNAQSYFSVMKSIRLSFGWDMLCGKQAASLSYKSILLFRKVEADAVWQLWTKCELIVYITMIPLHHLF